MPRLTVRSISVKTRSRPEPLLATPATGASNCSGPPGESAATTGPGCHKGSHSVVSHLHVLTRFARKDHFDFKKANSILKDYKIISSMRWTKHKQFKQAGFYCNTCIGKEINIFNIKNNTMWTNWKTTHFDGKCVISNFFKNCQSEKNIYQINLVESYGLVVKADGSWSRGRGFEPRHHILDGCKWC